MANAHALDGLVLIPNCDKIVPGMLMGALRINLPTVVCSGGPMLAGRVAGHKTSLSSTFEAVGKYLSGKISKEELDEYENHSCPSCGSCSGMYTANSMNCMCEVLGIALPGNGTIPNVYADRIRLAKKAGMAITNSLRSSSNGMKSRMAGRLLNPRRWISARRLSRLLTWLIWLEPANAC